MRTQRDKPRNFSFEFFPPRTPEGEEKLRATRRQLAQLKPTFMSCTFGAGGSTQEGTMRTVFEIQSEGHMAAPHISCIGSTRDAIEAMLDRYREAGIRRLVCLRGDLPSGMAVGGEFRYATDLVRFVRERTGGWFHIEVAAYPEFHPQARRPSDDLRHFKEKAEAGADSAITQYFYNADAYSHFVESIEAMGVDLPIVPGIMPINNSTQLARFSDACGAEIPRWIRLRLESFGDDTASIKAFGLDVVTELCDRLLRLGAPGLHFYTLNQASLTTTIWQRLGL
jgi:methylenetetrahydrofolate reductase (NADPH)